jgi:nitrogen fixation protein NifX
MKVAFCTSTGLEVDQNFGHADSYTIWDIGPRDSYYVHTVFAPYGTLVRRDDEITLRAEAIRECAIVCSREVSGPSVAKLVARRIHPLKIRVNTPVEELISRLQGVLSGNIPPWLCKELLKTPWLLADSNVWLNVSN